MMVLAEAEVPFADQSRGVAGRAQQVGQRALMERQSKLALGPDVRIELMPEASLIPAREQAGPRRAAIGRGHVAVGAANSRLRQLVDIRGRHGLAAVHADVPITQIIDDDEQNVRLGRLRPLRSAGCGYGRCQQGQDSKGCFHIGSLLVDGADSARLPETLPALRVIPVASMIASTSWPAIVWETP